MQVENLTKEQFIRDFKDTLHHEQLIKVAKATPTEIFTALAGLIRKYYTDTWIERNHALSDNQEKVAFYFSIEFLPGRMLETNLLNLGILDLVKEGFAELDIDFREVVEAIVCCRRECRLCSAVGAFFIFIGVERYIAILVYMVCDVVCADFRSV